MGEDTEMTWTGGASAKGQATAGPARRMRTSSADLEQALVEAAERVLVRDGPAGVSVRVVAAEAGVAPMGVYNRFGGKDGLVEVLLIRAFDGLRAAVQGEGGSDPVERLRSSGRRYRAFALANPQQYSAMFGQAFPEAVHTDRVGEHAGAAFGALVDHVRYAQERGIAADVDPQELAQQVWSAVHGAVSLELAGIVRTGDPGATYEALLQMLLVGLFSG